MSNSPRIQRDLIAVAECPDCLVISQGKRNFVGQSPIAKFSECIYYSAAIWTPETEAQFPPRTQKPAEQMDRHNRTGRERLPGSTARSGFVNFL